MRGSCYNACVEQLLSLIISTPLVAVLIVLVLALAAVLAIAYVVNRPTREHARADAAFQLLAVVSETLGMAEKLGKFGSFRWDFRDEAGTYWSDQMYVLFGLVKRAKPPRIAVFLDLAHPEDTQLVQQMITDATTKPGPFGATFRAIAPDKSERFVRVQGTSVVPSGHAADRVHGVVQDVTREMEVDKAKSEFVSLASHQLKTPLTAIRWLLEALESGAAGPFSPAQQGYLDKIKQSTLNTIAIVNDLLNVSRIEMNRLATQLEELDVKAMAESVIAEQQHAADARRVALSLVAAPLPHIQADRNALRMIIQNLVSNAIKYTPEGGSVRCDLSVSGARQQAIYLSVSDTGIGIPADEQPRVFEKLHRAANAQALAVEGTGLGLYVVKTVIERAGGAITFESREGKGSTFTVTIPLVWKTPPSAGIGTLS